MKSPSRKLFVEPYGRDLFFYTDRNSWARACVRKVDWKIRHARDQAAFAAGAVAWNDDLDMIVGVFDGSAGTLAHEMTHAALVILDGASVRFTARNNEAIAYLIGHLVDECWPLVCEAKKRGES